MIYSYEFLGYITLVTCIFTMIYDNQMILYVVMMIMDKKSHIDLCILVT